MEAKPKGYVQLAQIIHWNNVVAHHNLIPWRSLAGLRYPNLMRFLSGVCLQANNPRPSAWPLLVMQGTNPSQLVASARCGMGTALTSGSLSLKDVIWWDVLYAWVHCSLIWCCCLFNRLAENWTCFLCYYCSSCYGSFIHGSEVRVVMRIRCDWGSLLGTSLWTWPVTIW